MYRKLSLYSQTADVSVIGTTTETSLFDLAHSRPLSSLTLPGSFVKAGMVFDLNLRGFIGAVGADNNTLTGRFKLGGTTIASFSKQFTSDLAYTAWHISAMMTVWDATASGKFYAQGMCLIGGFTPFPLTATSEVTSFDWTASKAIDFTAQWSGSSFNELIRCTNAEILYTE